jgi:two-component system sensor histidine kinase BarA
VYRLETNHSVLLTAQFRGLVTLITTLSLHTMNVGAFPQPIPERTRHHVGGIVCALLLLLTGVGTHHVDAKGTAFSPASIDSSRSPGAEPISQVRKDANEDYVPDRVGDTVTVRGRTSTQQGFHVNEQLVFLQDETAGIAVQLPEATPVNRGDSLWVRGILQHRNGLARLQTLDYERIDAPARQPTPVPLTVSTAHGDTYEGQLVRIQGRVTAKQSNDGGNYLLIEGISKNTSAQLAVFVPTRHRNDMPLQEYEQGDKITATGVLGQNDYSPPYDEYYQLFPRKADDLSRVGLTWFPYRTVILLFVSGALVAGIAVFTLRTAVRRRTEQLAESRARFRRLAEATFEGIIIHEDGQITDVNRALLDMIGLERDDLVGREIEDVLSAFTHDFEQQVETTEAGPEDTYEVVMVREDGSSFPAEIEEKVVDVPDQRVRVAAIRNVTERKKWETEILLAKEKAEQMSRLKSSLLNNMSHELRTPITSIIGYAELIMNEPEADHTDFAAHIRQSGERLSRTLQAVLEMAQIESGTLDVQPHDVAVSSLVQDVVEEYRPMAHRKELSLEVDEDVHGQTVYTDRSLVHRVLDNLVHNAIKFTEAGTVRVAVEPADPGVRIAVSDTGIGIDPNFRDHLFEPFKQESEGRARTHEGTGLGLALTKRMLNLLGGTLEVETTKGEGSTFTVEVPPVPSADEPEGVMRKAETV